MANAEHQILTVLRLSTMPVSVYDVGRRETFENLRDIWLREVEMYCTGNSVVKMLVANKIDVEQRTVSREEGSELARSLGTMFFECSAKTKVGVQNAFEELLLKVCLHLNARPQFSRSTDRHADGGAAVLNCLLRMVRRF